MQTFLPYSDFTQSSKCLDKKRLFKQVIEARQILASNGISVEKNDGTFYKSTHKNHPCLKLWYGYDSLLVEYHNIFLHECFNRGIKTNIKFLGFSYHGNNYPKWLGNTDFHNAHKSNLLRKDPEFYGKYGWNVPDNLEYIWEV